MTGWVVMLLLAALVVLGLWRWVRRDMGALQFLAAALLLALAGYAWQGRPGLAGAPKARAVGQNRPDSDFAQLRRELLPQFDRAGAWLTATEALNREGNTLSAANMLRGQLDSAPRDMSLWLGYADTLIQHAGGALTPAAEMAFNRAAQLAPDHPAPRFFYALALARIGQFDGAEAYYAQVLALPRLSEAWRTTVDRARELTARMRSAGPVGPTGAAPPR